MEHSEFTRRSPARLNCLSSPANFQGGSLPAAICKSALPREDPGGVAGSRTAKYQEPSYYYQVTTVTRLALRRSECRRPPGRRRRELQQCDTTMATQHFSFSPLQAAKSYGGEITSRREKSASHQVTMKMVPDSVDMPKNGVDRYHGPVDLHVSITNLSRSYPSRILRRTNCMKQKKCFQCLLIVSSMNRYAFKLRTRQRSTENRSNQLQIFFTIEISKLKFKSCWQLDQTDGLAPPNRQPS